MTFKFKMADAEEVTGLMTDVVTSAFWASGISRVWADELVRDLHRALSDAGCLIIQVDNGEAS